MQPAAVPKNTRGRNAIDITLGDEPAMLDASGALYLPDRATLVFADLHFEKGSSYAEKGALLPPYDSATTLNRMDAVIACYAPQRVICLGDSFHDRRGADRMPGSVGGRLRRMADQRAWLWVLGNHDPDIPPGAGGETCDEVRLGRLRFLHETGPTPIGTTPTGPTPTGPTPTGPTPTGLSPTGIDVCGHFHPKARIRAGPRRITRPCFIGDGRRMILPSFGAYTGGLDICSPAIAQLFPSDFTAWLISKGSVYAFPSATTRFVPFEH